MAKIDELDYERLGRAVLKAFEVGKMANVDRVSTALKDNVKREHVGNEAQFVFDLFTKKIEKIEEEWE